MKILNANTTILDFIVSNKEHTAGFVVGDSFPSDVPVMQEGFVIPYRDSDGDRVLVHYYIYATNDVKTYYSRSAFQGAWQQATWSKVTAVDEDFINYAFSKKVDSLSPNNHYMGLYWDEQNTPTSFNWRIDATDFPLCLFHNVGSYYRVCPSADFTTVLNTTHNICSINLTEGKWLIFGYTLACGDLYLDNATSIISRKSISNDMTSLVVGLRNSGGIVSLKLYAHSAVGVCHANGDYCGIFAIRLA